jgi:hypothetical protein
MLNFVQRRRLAVGLKKRGLFPTTIERANPPIEKVYMDLGGELGKRTGRAILCKCFYHDDRKASMALYGDNNTFFCFTCRASGNSFQLIIDKLGIPFKEAADYCKERGLV